jgi:hypothetical protein
MRAHCDYSEMIVRHEPWNTHIGVGIERRREVGQTCRRSWWIGDDVQFEGGDGGRSKRTRKWKWPHGPLACLLERLWLVTASAQ